MATDQRMKLYTLKLKNPVSVWLRWQDFPMFLENFLYQNYHLPLKPDLSPALTIVDLGGNCGMASLYFSQYYYPNARYVIVEPSADNLRILKKNIAQAGLRADIVAGAVGPVNGEMALEENCIGYNVHLKDPTDSALDSGDTKVPVYTLDHLIHHYQIDQIDLLKMDIEGAEKAIFQHQGPWLTRAKCIILEIHGDFTAQNLRNAVELYGFIVQPTRHPAVFWMAKEQQASLTFGEV